jgi:hypothetical protein
LGHNNRLFLKKKWQAKQGGSLLGLANMDKKSSLILLLNEKIATQ